MNIHARRVGWFSMLKESTGPQSWPFSEENLQGHFFLFCTWTK